MAANTCEGKKMYISALLTCLLSLAPSSATSTSPADTVYYETAPIEVDPIIVMGQRDPKHLSRTVNSVISLPPKSLQNSPHDNILADLQYGHASISTSTVNGVGYGVGSAGHGEVLIRGLGFSPNRGTLVLIDGRPDIAGLFGHPLPDTYRSAGLFSAELIKGGASTLYGSNAIAGVLNLESFYRPDLARFTSVELTGGSHATFSGTLRHSRRWDNFVAAAWYDYVESDNHRKDSEYFNRSGGFRLQYTGYHGFNVFLSAKYSTFDFADAGPVYQPERFTGDIQRAGFTLGIDSRSDRLSLTGRFYSSYGEHSFSDGFRSIDRNNGMSLTGRLENTVIQGLALTGGLALSYLGGSAYDGSAFVLPGDFHEYEYATHLQAEYSYEQLLQVTLGGRYVDHDRYDGHFVYQAGAVVSPGNWGSLKFSVGSAYRNPTVSESQLFLISNADSLVAEEGTFYEIGYFNRLSPHLSLETAVFWREGENLIASVSNPDPPPRNLFQNSGSYSHSGWEAALRFVHGEFFLAPSFLHLNQDNYSGSVPEDKLVLTTGAGKGRWRARMETTAAFKTASDSVGVPVILDDYVVVNLDQSLELAPSVRLKLRFENIFDTDYETVSGYPMPGVTFRAGAVVTLL